MAEMKKTITAEGVRIAHPSGLVTTTTLAQLEKLIDQEKQEAERMAQRVREIEADIEAVKAARAR
jgi:hypothetical protein